MTQKELLYFEDAYGHINNIIKILNDFILKIQDKEIKTFMENELEQMYCLNENIINVLGGKANG